MDCFPVKVQSATPQTAAFLTNSLQRSYVGVEKGGNHKIQALQFHYVDSSSRPGVVSPSLSLSLSVCVRTLKPMLTVNPLQNI